MTFRESTSNATLKPGGKLGSLIDNIINRWLVDIRETNPAILDMFHDAGLKPYRHLLAWSGEFAGKFITCSCLLLSMTNDKNLREALDKFIPELISCQKINGYLGPFSKEHELTGTVEPTGYCFDKNFEPEAHPTWDAWGHYHIMLGLLYWYDLTKDEDALECVKSIANLFCSKFYGEGKPRLHSIGSHEMNLAPIHSFALLYGITKDKKYLDFALEILKDFEIPPAGDYLRQALDNIEFFKMPKPRWESLHLVQGIAELYRITGDESYKKAVFNIWESITKTDIHNTGGFTTGEQATGCPYDEGPIETCCTISYMALTVDILKLFNHSIAADMLELCTYNASMGSFSPSGRWSTYDTPMAGYKRANYDSIHFQCRPGSPDLNCCSVNAPRAFGMLAEWAYQLNGDSLIINYYGEHTRELPFNGEQINIAQKTEYPYDGAINIEFNAVPKTPFKLKLRIPFWSKKYTVMINGKHTTPIYKDGYILFNRKWQNGDLLRLELDMPLHIWAGEGRLENQGSIYKGPLLLCFDPFYDRSYDINKLPVIEPTSFTLDNIDVSSVPGGLFNCYWKNDETRECSKITLCDLYTAGSSGTPYTTWIPMSGLTAKDFVLSNPLRSTQYNGEKVVKNE